MTVLSGIINSIAPVDAEAFAAARRRLDTLAKPPGSLGALEEIAARLCAIAGDSPLNIGKRCVIVMAADNGVVAEGVSSAPQAVTAIQTMNILAGITGVGVLARQFATDLLVADIGINADISHPLLLKRKIRKSTGNIAKEPAMTAEEAEAALICGAELAYLAAESGYRAIGVGEMGIGNTTTSSAVLAALLNVSGAELENLTGRGAGLDDAAYRRKVEVINTALALHQPNSADPLDVLSKVGGLDLAAMTGVFLGAASRGLPVVIDGFISVVAAICACRLNPLARDYMFASHHSYERGYAQAAAVLGLKPSLNLEMRLGEGSGCPLMFAVMDAALAVLTEMATFDEASISGEYTENIDSIGF